MKKSKGLATGSVGVGSYVHNAQIVCQHGDLMNCYLTNSAPVYCLP